MVAVALVVEATAEAIAHVVNKEYKGILPQSSLTMEVSLLYIQFLVSFKKTVYEHSISLEKNYTLSALHRTADTM